MSYSIRYRHYRTARLARVADREEAQDYTVAAAKVRHTRADLCVTRRASHVAYGDQRRSTW
jgi:hypothetical protein